MYVLNRLANWKKYIYNGFSFLLYQPTSSTQPKRVGLVLWLFPLAFLSTLYFWIGLLTSIRSPWAIGFYCWVFLLLWHLKTQIFRFLCIAPPCICNKGKAWTANESWYQRKPWGNFRIIYFWNCNHLRARLLTLFWKIRKREFHGTFLTLSFLFLFL